MISTRPGQSKESGCVGGISAPAGPSDHDQVLAKIAAHVPGLVYQFILRPDGSSAFPYSSPGILDIYGVTPAEAAVSAHSVIERLHPEDRERVMASIGDSAAHGALWLCDYRYCHPSGDVRWLQGRAMPERLADGAILWHGFITDIGHMKVLEEQQRHSARAAAAAMRESEALFSTLLAHSLVSVTDGAGTIIEVNDQFCRISGYRREELIGANHRLLNSGVQGRAFWVDMWQTVVGGTSWRAEVCNRAKDGSLYWVDSVVAPFVDTHGRIEKIVSIRNDITDRKRAEAERLRLTALQQGILDSANLAIIATDPVGVITMWNATATSLLKWTAEEMVGKQTPAIIHLGEEVVARTSDLTRELGIPVVPGFGTFAAKARIDRVADEREWSYVRKDGSRFPVRLSVTALRDASDTVTGYLGIAADITESRPHQQELLQAKDSAEAGLRAKAEFLATMSHEIRTPMNGVIGMTDLLLDTTLDAQQQEFAQTIRSCGESLLVVINDILDVSKLDAGKVELELIPFSITRVVTDIIVLLSSQAASKQLNLTCQIPRALPAQVIGDPTRIRQILLNLVSNALKFTATGSVIVRIVLLAEDSRNLRLAIEVQDTGIGLLAGQIERLGQAFMQADSSTTRRFGGSGLGITICMQLLSLMKSGLEVESTLGRGSCFRFVLDLPLGAMDGQPALVPASAAAAWGMKMTRVLVVDDTVINRRIMELLLQKVATRIDVAVNGVEAVQAVLDHCYDCVFMDCQMPEMDGYQATAAIRRHEATASLPRQLIIALTAHALPGDKERCLEVGMDDYLSKPIREKDLLAALGRHLNATG